jgi:FkbM family methyltransferase
LLVEPLEKFNNSLLNCYSYIENLFIENLAITDEENKDYITFYLHNNMDENCEQASLLKSHVIKHFPSVDSVTEKNVKCIKINNLFDKYNLKDIDLLFIDAEGIDDKIIKSIDFEKYNINTIYYENMHIDKNDMSIFLENKGYEVINGTDITQNNSYAIKKNI